MSTKKSTSSQETAAPIEKLETSKTRLIRFITSNSTDDKEIQKILTDELSALLNDVGDTTIRDIKDTIRNFVKSEESINTSYVLEGLSCCALKKLNPDLATAEIKHYFYAHEAFKKFCLYKRTEKFFFYYWRNRIGIAYLELSFDIFEKLITGELTYFIITGNGIVKNTNLKTSQLSSGSKNTGKNLSAVFFYRDLVTQLIIPWKNDSFSKITLCSYSVVDSNSFVAGGIGILEKIDSLDDKIQDIKIAGGIDPLIENKLYLRREEVLTDERLIESISDFNNKKEIDFFRNLSGMWIGVYMRRDKVGPEGISGGVETMLMEIKANGLMRLIGSEFAKGNQADVYDGYASFPDAGNNNFLKANFKMQFSKIYSIHIFLENDNDIELNGVISGWSDENKPFSGLIHFIKSPEPIIPKTYSKQEIEFNDNDPLFNYKLLTFFQNKNKQYLNLPGDCLSKNYAEYSPKEIKLAGMLAGKYFLFSYDKKEGTILRVKAEIETNGFVKIQYGDIYYNGVALYKRYSINDEGYLIFDLFEKEMKGQKEKFWGYYLFETGDLLHKYKADHYSYIKFIPGISIRVNNLGEPQSKREYLIPSSSAKEFDAANKYEFNYVEDKIGDVKGGKDPSDFVSLRRFILSLKGKTENILRVTKDSFNNIETTTAHRRNNYHEIFFNCVLITGAFDSPDEVNKLKCREYLLQSILHGLDLSTINLSLNIFYRKFKTSSVIQKKISGCCGRIATIILKFNMEGKNHWIKKLMLLEDAPSSGDAIALTKSVSEFINLLPKLVQ